MKKKLYRLILIIIIFSSIMGIYKQLSILLNAQNEISQTNSKILEYTQKNNALKKSLNY